MLQELLGVAADNRPAYLQRYIFAVLQRVNILIGENDVDKEFWAFGMDSLNQVEVVLILSEDLAVDLPGTLLRDQSTISKLTDYLLSHVPVLNAAIAKNKEAKNRIYTLLDHLKLEYVPSHTNFVFFHSKKDIRELGPKMLEKGVRIGRPFPPFYDWCRVSTGTLEEVDVFIKGMLEVYEG